MNCEFPRFKLTDGVSLLSRTTLRFSTAPSPARLAFNPDPASRSLVVW